MMAGEPADPSTQMNVLWCRSEQATDDLMEPVHAPAMFAVWNVNAYRHNYGRAGAYI